MEFCLNLCEILNPLSLSNFSVKEIIEKALEKTDQQVQRIYIGSSFCSQYFLKMIDKWGDLFSYAKDNAIPITLTVPIFSQKDLKEAKEAIKELLENSIIDEITVNDLGLLAFIQREKFDVEINLGRLFFKDPRDIRVSGYYRGKTKTPAALSLLSSFGRINGIELDQISEREDWGDFNQVNTRIALHYPYTYMTTGNICKFASIGKPVEEKFRPNAPCAFQCSRIHEFFYKKFEGSEEESELFRFGRTVYFLNERTDINGREPDRIVFFPLKELALFNEEEIK